MENIANEFINFVKLKESHLDLMLKWLNTDFVKECYGKNDFTYQDVVNKYLPRILKKEPTESYLILYANTPIGYIQTYLIKDYPDYNQYVHAGEDVAGVDLFIGEKDFIHRGLGSIILKKFLSEIVFDNDIVSSCMVGPEPKNIIAIKTYEKVGFKYVKMIQIPDEDEPEYLMEVKRVE